MKSDLLSHNGAGAAALADALTISATELRVEGNTALARDYAEAIVTAKLLADKLLGLVEKELARG